MRDYCAGCLQLLFECPCSPKRHCACVLHWILHRRKIRKSPNQNAGTISKQQHKRAMSFGWTWVLGFSFTRPATILTEGTLRIRIEFSSLRIILVHRHCPLFLCFGPPIWPTRPSYAFCIWLASGLWFASCSRVLSTTRVGLLRELRYNWTAGVIL